SRLRRVPDRADDVAEMNVDLPRAVDRAEELDAAGAIDEVEECQLPHVAPCHHAPCEAALGLRLTSVLQLLGLCADRRDVVAVREALRGRGHVRESVRGRLAKSEQNKDAGRPRTRRYVAD